VPPVNSPAPSAPNAASTQTPCRRSPAQDKRKMQEEKVINGYGPLLVPRPMCFGCTGLCLLERIHAVPAPEASAPSVSPPWPWRWLVSLVTRHSQCPALPSEKISFRVYFATPVALSRISFPNLDRPSTLPSNPFRIYILGKETHVQNPLSISTAS
jgi:hypothetical protein